MNYIDLHKELAHNPCVDVTYINENGTKIEHEKIKSFGFHFLNNNNDIIETCIPICGEQKNYEDLKEIGLIVNTIKNLKAIKTSIYNLYISNFKETDFTQNYKGVLILIDRKINNLVLQIKTHKYVNEFYQSEKYIDYIIECILKKEPTYFIEY